jgi:hypothetical protein
MDRVKELENVNDKIKQMLANKREPSTLIHFQPHTQARVFSNYKRERADPVTEPIQATPKRMTSLFQNERPIVESKVDPDVWAVTSREGKHY